MSPKTNKLDFCSQEFTHSMLSNLHNIYKAQTFCDIKLEVAGQTFCAHRSILAAASEYFHAMFSGGLSESEQNTVQIYGIPSTVFSSLLDFMYTGRVRISVEDCQDLLTAADMLRLSTLVDACCSFMTQQLNSANCIGVCQLADIYSCQELKKSAQNYLVSHILQVVKEEEFLSMPKEMLTEVLTSEDLSIEQEYEVFEAALKWILSEVVNRRKYIFDILANVRFPLIPQYQLEKYIETCPDLSVKVALHKLVKTYKYDPGGLKTKYKPLLYLPRKSAYKSIYIVGGYSRDEGGRWSDSQTLGTVECFNMFHAQWRCIPPLQFSRSGHGVVLLNRLIYVIGGESDSLIFDNVECLDPLTNKWRVVESLRMPRCGLGACVVEGRIYVLGGWVGSEIGHTIECYDPQQETWTVSDNMHQPKFAMGIIEDQGLIYVVGGMTDDGIEMSSVDSYNAVTKEWCSLAPMKEHRGYVGVAVLDGCIYAVGGWNQAKGALSSVEKYSIDKDCWCPVASLSMGRAGASVCAVSGLLYVLGGRTFSSHSPAPSTLKHMECYDPRTDSWTYHSSMPTSRCEAGVVIV